MSNRAPITAPNVEAQGVAYPTVGRVLHAPGIAVFLSGLNLILIQWILVRELTALLLGTELVILLVSVAYFAGLSVGFWMSSLIQQSWLAPLSILTLILHLTLPVWFRLLVSGLDAIGVYGAAFFILPMITPFFVSAFYSVLIPKFVDSSEGSLPRLYALELFGSAMGILVLVVLGTMGLTNVLFVYTASLLVMASVLGIHPWVLIAVSLVSVTWMFTLPGVNNWSNALWYIQLRNLPVGTITLFTAYSPYQKVDVLQDPDGHRYLYLDGLLHFGTDRWSRLNVMMGSVPADLLRPETSLVIGAGSMHLERLIAEYGGHVTTVELDPIVVEASTRFFLEYNALDTLTNRTIVLDDARHYIANTSQTFDLIVTDVPAAFSIQTATLYSVPFYREIAGHLTPDGILVVNLTTRFHENNPISRRITASLLEVFDDVMIVTSDSSRLSYAFAGHNIPFDLQMLQTVLERHDETTYTLFNHTVIEQLTANTRPISLDSMDIVLQISAEWVTDRLTWRE